MPQHTPKERKKNPKTKTGVKQTRRTVSSKGKMGGKKR